MNIKFIKWLFWEQDVPKNALTSMVVDDENDTNEIFLVELFLTLHLVHSLDNNLFVLHDLKSLLPINNFLFKFIIHPILQRFLGAMELTGTNSEEKRKERMSSFIKSYMTVPYVPIIFFADTLRFLNIN